jgi:hypothetical protein
MLTRLTRLISRLLPFVPNSPGRRTGISSGDRYRSTDGVTWTVVGLHVERLPMWGNYWAVDLLADDQHPAKSLSLPEAKLSQAPDFERLSPS